MSVLVRALRGRVAERDTTWPSLSMDDFASFFGFNGLAYPMMPGTTLAQERELPPSDFAGYVNLLYRNSPIVFATVAARHRIFSQARFQFQRMSGGTPGDLFGSALLAPLERPWGPSSTTSDLLGRMILDADLAGNAYVARIAPDRLTHLRPDWVIIVAGSKSSADKNPNWQLDAEVIGYIYMPGGLGGDQPQVLMPENVAHFAPHPDPLARWRGMSWLTPTIRDVMSDTAATQHKLMFFEQGATPNVVVSLNENVTPENFARFVEIFQEENEGVANAYKTLFFGGGASVDVVGANLQQISFKEVQGAVETRIAAAGGVPPIIPGFSEGLQYATYSNYSQARRAFADGTLAHLWGNAAGSLETLVDMNRLPGGGSNARLWYDARHIAFLKADVKEDAEVQQVKAATLNSLITGGWDPEVALKAVESGDFSLMAGSHTGLISVQLFKPGAKDTPNVPLPGKDGEQKPALDQGAPPKPPAGPGGKPPTPPAPPAK